MGRCIKYELAKETAFTKKELSIIKEFNIKYNSGKYKNIWSCENYNIACDIPENKKITSLICFTKIQGNEYNGLLLINILTELSKLMDITVYIKDEGRLIIGSSIKMKNGKILPNFDEINNSLHYVCYRYAINKIDDKNVLNIISKLSKPFKNDLEIIVSKDKDVDIEYVNEILTDLLEIDKIFQKLHFFDYNSPYNIAQLENKYWLEPEVLLREVNEKDFEDFQMNETTIMGGYYGEYWNLNKNKDAEIESYKQLSLLQGLLQDGMSMKVIGINDNVNKIKK
jgi:hypothetical protein